MSNHIKQLKMKKIFFFASALSILITQTGCFGSFELVKKVYEVNDGISNNKFVKSLVFWIGGIFYSIAGLADAVIFNLIEFWTGSNPLAMAPGEYEEQLMTMKGQDYKVVASKNQFAFFKIQGDATVDMGVVRFNEEDKSWNFVQGEEKVELIRIEGEKLIYNTPHGVQTADISVLEQVNTHSFNLATLSE